MTHRILSIRFPKAPAMLPEELRRLVNQINNWANTLLHNHGGEDELGYPRVQYRSIANRPAIWGLDEGIDAVETIIDELSGRLGKPTVQFDEFEPGKYINLLKYKCESLLPFNEENYSKWKGEVSLRKRVELVEGLLKDHVSNFYQNLGANMQGRDVNLVLHTMDRKPSVEFSGSGQTMKFLCFETIFFTDLLLPVGLGLGKGKAKGHGITLPMEVH
jgi:hypothetical protein